MLTLLWEAMGDSSSLLRGLGVILVLSGSGVPCIVLVELILRLVPRVSSHRWLTDYN